HLLGAFLEEYSTPERLRSADLKDIQERYFKHLGLYRRAGWLVKMVDQLLRDPPRPGILRQKNHRYAGYACEVAHLAGVGDYSSDAWRLFCKKSFCAGHQIVVADEWRTLEPKDKNLRRYVERETREEQVRLLTDDVISRMAAVERFSISLKASTTAWAADWVRRQRSARSTTTSRPAEGSIFGLFRQRAYNTVQPSGCNRLLNARLRRPLKYPT
ncbi:hypothetical protein LTR33_017616, partial [Friedmanniomyces endolithicus]